jgi:hypothetical protein
MGDKPPPGLWGGMPGFVFFITNIIAPLIRRRGRRLKAALPSPANGS